MSSEPNVLHPIPEFVTSITEHWAVYAWKVDCGGIMVFGNSKDESLQKWIKSYSEEYGKTPVMQTEMFAA